MELKTKKEAEKIDVNDVIETINNGIVVTGQVVPILKELFNKIKAFVEKVSKGDPDSPRNVRFRLAALEAKDNLQREVNRNLEERLAAVEALNAKAPLKTVK
jgi:MoxR-like ATPase